MRTVLIRDIYDQYYSSVANDVQNTLPTFVDLLLHAPFSIMLNASPEVQLQASNVHREFLLFIERWPNICMLKKR